MASLAHAEVISGTNFDAKNWNLIANFREGSGVTTNDSSSNTIAMTLTNGPTWVSNKTGRGYAINFDGSNDLVTAPVGSEGLFDFDVRSTFTVVVLFRNPSGGNNRVLVSKVNWVTPEAGWIFVTGASGAKLGAILRGGLATYQYLDAVGITDAMFINDRWHTAAFVYRGKLHGSELKEFWFDGVEYGKSLGVSLGSPPGTMLNNNLLTIGDRDDAGEVNMIDDVGCVMVSRNGYAPDAVGMMSLHRRLMGQVSNGEQ